MPVTPDVLKDTATYPDLSGKVAIVTGGSRALGAQTARGLAANGVAVAVVGRDAAALDAVTDGLWADGHRALGIVADCTVAEEVERIASTVAAELGPVDILAAFAGGNGMPVPTVQESPVHWREVVDTDLTATFLTVRELLPGMIQRRGGAIVTMSSSAGRQAALSSAAYAAAKAGVVAFTRHLAAEVGPDGVRVNCLAPSSVENERLLQWTTAEQRAGMAESYPLRRIGQPRDVAAATLFLASDASSWITGVTLDVAGGKIML